MDETGITETVSQNPPKRGRPSLMCPKEMADAKKIGLFENIKSRRGRNNVHYWTRALLLIGGGEDPDFFWICDGPGIEKGEKRIRRVILTELGRIADDEGLLDVARHLCKTQPKTGAAVAMIRRYRLGDSMPFASSVLADKFRDTINAHLQRYPGTDWSEILEALADVQASVKDRVEDLEP